MKKRIYSILMVVVMTIALVACGTAQSSPDSEAVETVKEVVESADTENSEAVSETEQATEAPVDEAAPETESAEIASEPESSETASTPETSTEENSEAVSEPDSEAVESEASEPEPTVPEFTVTEVTATKYATQSVNVRSGPSTDFDKIGGLTTNQEITVNGVCDQTGWYRFTWTDGREAYVSDRYVSDSKVEVQKPADNSGSGTGSTASNSCPYTLWQPVDNGDSITWYCAYPDPDWDTNGHRQTLKWIFDTLTDRNKNNIPDGYIGCPEQTESTIMGYYTEGEVRRQTYVYKFYPKDSLSNF